MKSAISFLISLSFAQFLAISSAPGDYLRADFMPPQEAQKKWGSRALDKNLFKNGDPTKRLPMGVYIALNQLYVGQPMKLVRTELGDPDSYFFSDSIFAYKIMPFPGEGKENWHLVFIPDEKLERVKAVKIHKKCCYEPLRKTL